MDQFGPDAWDECSVLCWNLLDEDDASHLVSLAPALRERVSDVWTVWGEAFSLLLPRRVETPSAAARAPVRAVRCAVRRWDGQLDVRLRRGQ